MSDYVTIPDAFYRLTQEENLPYSFESVRPTGILKSIPEDFVVEEVPAYEASGSGDFLYLWLEKTGIDMVSLLKIMGETLDLPEKEIGYAGIKDKHAVTRQWMSVPAACEAALPELEKQSGIRVLDIKRHEHRIRTGKLRGNRFDIHVRSSTYDWEPVEETAKFLAEHGVANFYGGQRFGHRGKSASLGWALLLGEKSKRTQKAKRSRFMRKFALSAAQGLIFNRIAEVRMERGELRSILPNDILQKRESGGLFLSEDQEVEHERLSQHEIVPTGRIVGRKDRWKSAPERPWEAEVIRESGIPPEAYDSWGKLALGTRRPLIVFPEDMGVSKTPEGFRVQFYLQSGSYATVVMREFFKTESSPDITETLPTHVSKP